MNCLRITLVSTLLPIMILGCSDNQNKETSGYQISGKKTSLDTLTRRSKSTFSFTYDPDNFQKFGIQFFEHDLPVGPQDVLMVDSSIFILDQYHHNLKKINLQGEIINASKPLSDRNIWLKQFAILKDKIFVISKLDSLYIYSLNLELLDKKYLQKGNGRVYHVTREVIVLYYPMIGHEFIELNDYGVVVNQISGIEHKKDYMSNISCSDATITINNKIFVTDPVDLRKLTHYITDRTIISINPTPNQLVIDLFNY